MVLKNKKEVNKKEVEKKEVTKKKSGKKRAIVVILFLIIFAIYLFFSIRGDYLQTLEIGKKYENIFSEKLKFRVIVTFINFAFLYITTFVITSIIKSGLKEFFDKEKKEMPKLPRKSISLFVSAITSMIMSNMLTQKALLAFNSTYFGKTDPVFNIDIGYYIFQKPFVETILIYLIGLMIAYTIYIITYYIIVFNRCFDKGVDREVLKNSLFIKQIIVNIVIMTIVGTALILVKTQDILFSKFLNIGDGYSLIGAGIIEVGVKTWGYRIFAFVVFICVLMAVKNIKVASFKKIALWLCGIPVYLIVLFLIMVITNAAYVSRNELDKQKFYIERNIEYTKNAYDINIEEIEISTNDALNIEDINQNRDVIDNINISNKETVLSSLKQYQTNLGYYTYSTTKEGIYNIDGKDTLLYVSPREIVSNETRTYNNKTYEYTHGYGVIATDANKANENGSILYLQSEFDGSDNVLKIKEPRIYFGMQTNEYIITNAKNQEEYDYPLSTTTNSSNKYNGTAGLKLGFLDRLILSFKENNLKMAFTGNITKDSKVITTRNIRERAKTILPDIMYDENPYMVVTDDGRLVWVLDAYTTSNNYPYSMYTTIEYEGSRKKINYIRNSAKVIIDAYNGDTYFYITDRTDPIIMAYNKLYPGIFEEGSIPENISNHLVYPQFLYKVQAEVLQKYHNVQVEVLYRADDIWSIANENTTKTASGNTKGTAIVPYYTMVKTLNSNKSELGLVVPYTIINKQNLVSYLVGIYDAKNNQPKLTMYRFKTSNAILGTNQLDALVEQDEKIEKELESVAVTGSKITKNIIVVPINDTLLYVEPIYQTMLNEETQAPILKKIIVASGNKIAIGNDLTEALSRLLSQEAISVEVDTENKEELIEQIINANNNLKQSNQSNNWELIGKDIERLQGLITQLEEIVENENKQKEKIEKEQSTKETKTQSVNVSN